MVRTSDLTRWMILPRVDVTDVGVDCTWNGFSALEVLFRPGAVSFTFGTWRLEGEACIHGVFMTVLLVAGSYSSPPLSLAGYTFACLVCDGCVLGLSLRYGRLRMMCSMRGGLTAPILGTCGG